MMTWLSSPSMVFEFTTIDKWSVVLGGSGVLLCSWPFACDYWSDIKQLNWFRELIRVRETANTTSFHANLSVTEEVCDSEVEQIPKQANIF